MEPSTPESRRTFLRRWLRRGPARAPSAAPSGRFTGWRLWLARLAMLVAAPLLVLGLLEAGLRVAGYGYPTAFFLKSPDGRVYVANERFGRRFSPRSLADVMQPTCVSARKAPGTVRIFVLGESAAMGIPDPAFSFSRVLEVMLRERHPGARLEVVNAALLGIGSPGVRDIALECADLEPDLFVIYMGNNEIVGPYSPVTLPAGLPHGVWAIRAALWAKTFRVGQLADSAEHRLGWFEEDACREQDMAFFREHRVPPGDPRLREVVRSFRANLADMCGAARGAGARVVVATVANNLRDCPPLGSRHRTDLADEDRAGWEVFYAQGVRAEGEGRHQAAAELYAKAAVIDDQFADLHFRWARCLRALGQLPEARAHYVKARDLDALAFRATGPISDAVREFAAGREAEGIRLADVAAAMERPEVTPDGIPGAEAFYEHVHLTFTGNYEIAAALLPAVEASLPGSVSPAEAAAPVPTRQACAERLAYTPWDEARLLAMMAAVVSKPPFLDQIDHGRQLAALRSELDRRRHETSSREALDGTARVYEAAMQARPDDLSLAMNFALLELDRGHAASAAQEMAKVLAVFPRWKQMRAAEGLALSRAGKHDEAVALFTEMLRQEPRSLDARHGLATALAAKGDLDGAIAQLNEVLRTDPSPQEYGRLAGLLMQRRRPGEALETLGKGLERFPGDAGLHDHRGKILLAIRKFVDAASEFREASKLDPTFVEARANLALALDVQGKAEEAVREYRAALAIDPRSRPALLGLAWILATDANPSVRNGEEAVRLAKAACDLGADPAALDVLAAAHAEAGRFDEAGRAVAEAVRLASASGNPRAADGFRARQELYSAGKPFRRR